MPRKLAYTILVFRGFPRVALESTAAPKTR